MKKTISNKNISNKIAKIMKEGVRGNTHKPYSKKNNPRHKVSQKQAVAIALSMAKRGRLKKKTT